MGQPKPYETPSTAGSGGSQASCRFRAACLAALIALALSIGQIIVPFPPSALCDEQSKTQSAKESATLYTCSMHPQVLQEKQGSCPICAMKLTPVREEATGGAAEGTAARGERKILYWWDPMMNPPYISDKPGKSPMGMDLVPVYEDEARGGPAVTIDPIVTQNMGIRVATVTRGPLSTSVRAAGYVTAAQPNEFDVALKTGGFIERLYANTEGMFVRKGQPLFDLYSADLLVAREELLAAQRSLDRLGAGADPTLREESERLVDDAKVKLEILGMSPGDVDSLAKSGGKSEAEPGARSGGAGLTITFRSPASGFIVEKNVVQGSAVEPGERLFRIVDLSTVWLEAAIYESQMDQVAVGRDVRATIKGIPGHEFTGTIVFLSPEIDPNTRTIVARVALPNGDLSLKPGMYGTVEIAGGSHEDAVQVPREAVIDTGLRQIVFVALEGGRFEPRNVRMGIETPDGAVEILEGLAPGETVVTSGQFLLDTESNTREAIQKLTGAGLKEPPAEGAGGAEVPGGSAGTAPAESAAAAARPQAPAQPVGADVRRATDMVLAIYLEMAEALAADTPIERTGVDQLSNAAQDLVEAAGKSDLAPLAQSVANAAQGMRQAAIADQRKQFKVLGASVIDLMGRVTPSNAVATRLYVVHCPMFNGDWVQTDKEIKNPYFGKSMLECGTVTRSIDTVEEK